MTYLPLTKENIEVLKEQLPTMKDKFLKICLDALDTDVTPKDEVPDDVACAEVESTLLKKVFPDFPILPSTTDLDFKLFTDKRFERITEPEIGCIIISPRNATNYGHVGTFITSERIASNNSFGPNKGKYTGNYTYEAWIQEFKVKRGLRIYLYRIKD